MIRHMRTVLYVGALCCAGALCGQVVTSPINPMTTLGDMIYGQAAGAPGRIAGSVSANTYCLLQTGTGAASAQPMWGPCPANGTLTYYIAPTPSNLTNGSAVVNQDVQMLTPPYSPITNIDIAHNASGDVVLQSAATDPGFPGLTFIPAGQYTFHIHAERLSGNRAVTLYGVFREVTATGVAVGTIGTQTELTPALTGSQLEYALQMPDGNTYSLASLTSRIVLDIHAVFTGGSTNTTVRLFVGGTADSHISLPSNTVDATSFVPYTGATADVNLGGHNLFTGTTIPAGAPPGSIAAAAIYADGGHPSVPRNVFVGGGGQHTATGGYNNVGVGIYALNNNTTAMDGTAVGAGALGQNTTGNDNTAVGNGALGHNVAGVNNTALGAASLYTTGASDNTAVGMEALYMDTTGTSNVAVGGEDMYSLTTGSRNSSLGYYALFSLLTGNDNTGIGDHALTAATGSGATAVGSSALAALTSGSGTAVGFEALKENVIGTGVTAVGMSALAKSTVNNNTAVGERALANTTTGDSNVAVGDLALLQNVSGTSNVAVGSQVSFSNTTGSNNVSFGVAANYNVTTGNDNTALGPNTCLTTTTGGNNTCVGSGAGVSDATSSHRTVIGSGALGAIDGSVTLGRNVDVVVIPGTMIVTPLAATSGQVFVCATTTGLLVRSATACVGTI